MRRFLGITLPLLAVCMMAGNVALAQGQGRGRGGFSGPRMRQFQFSLLSLAAREDVQKELTATAEQKTKIEGIRQDLFAGFQRGGGGGNQNLSDEERQKRDEEMRKKGEEATEKLTAELTADQNSRLKQVQVWAQGSHALIENADVAKGLNLTADQKEALKTINDEADKKTGELRGQGGPGQNVSDEERAKRREQSAAIAADTNAECMAVLTDEQKAQFDKIKGAKFQLDPNVGGFGGPGGRRGRPGANNN